MKSGIGLHRLLPGGKIRFVSLDNLFQLLNLFRGGIFCRQLSYGWFDDLADVKDVYQFVPILKKGRGQRLDTGIIAGGRT